MATLTFTTENVDNCCRTCLTDSAFTMYDIFEESSNSVNAAEMLSSCTSLLVSRGDRLPKQLCASCYTSIVNFYDFKRIAEKIDKTLRHHFINQQTITNDYVSTDDGKETDIKIENVDSKSIADYDLDDYHANEIKQEDVGPIDQRLLVVDWENNMCAQLKQYSKHSTSHFKENHKHDKKIQQNQRSDPHIAKLFKCLICSKSFRLHSEYVKHMEKHDKSTNINSQNTEETQNINQSFQCDTCGDKFKSINSLSAHKRKHTKKGRVLSCSLCNKVFPKVSHLKRHELCHENNRPYKCNLCKKSFTTESVLLEHINKHNGEKPLCCPICSKRCAHRSTLVIHMKIHTKEKSFHLCSKCGKTFNSSTSLNQHLKRHLGIRMYACNMCPKRFLTKGELKTHSETHSGNRSYVCEICNASFAQRGVLSNHSRAHLGVKPFHCDVCPMKFKRNFHLQRHHRVHSGERPYRCEICERAFTQSNDLEKHRRRHLGNDLYKCDQCSQSFRLKTELRQHISQHFVTSQIEAPNVANNIRNNLVVMGQCNKKGDGNDNKVQNKDMAVHVGNEM